MKRGFTLSEVLITLGIIGVVAAITIPNVIANYQKKVTLSKLKKAYSTIAQVMQKSFEENGSSSDFITENQEIDAEKSKTYFETYWLPYFKNIEVAEDGNSFYEGYEYYFAFKTLDNDVLNLQISTKYNIARVLFKASDETIYFIVDKNQINEIDSEGNEREVNIYNSIIDIYVDINGTKGPNMLGKDVFYFVAQLDNNKITGGSQHKQLINQSCRKNSTGRYCAAKIMQDNWEIKDDYPW